MIKDPQRREGVALLLFTIQQSVYGHKGLRSAAEMVTQPPLALSPVHEHISDWVEERTFPAKVSEVSTCCNGVGDRETHRLYSFFEYQSRIRNLSFSSSFIAA